MADLDPRSTTNDGKPESPAQNRNVAGEPHRNSSGDARAAGGDIHAHTPAPGGDGGSPPPADERDDRSGLERAEAIVDNVAARVSSLIGVWGRQFLRLTSRARESVQDFWADVQDFRHGKKP